MKEGVKEAAKQGISLLGLLLILLLCVVLIYLLFWRPIKRLAVLRHLENPAWAVPATQRIQDLWRRVQIGLNDAGVELSSAIPADLLADHASNILAKQFGTPPPGLIEAAEIYTRVHYNIGVQPNDLTEMAAAVELFTSYIDDKLSSGEQIQALYRGLPSEDP